MLYKVAVWKKTNCTTMVQIEWWKRKGSKCYWIWKQIYNNNFIFQR